MSELKAMTVLDVQQMGCYDNVFVYFKSEADKKLRRQKYKRCLAMAKWCKFWANYWSGCIPSDCSKFILRARHYRKWHKRWLELAKKFKEAK